MIRTQETCPIGILADVTLAHEHPARKKEILEHGIAQREREMIISRESKKMLSWHPVELIKTILVVGIVAFLLAYSVAQLSAFGHWYANARTTKLSVSIPLIGKEAFPVGSYLPTSTAMTTFETLPSLSVNESVMITIIAMAIVLIERFVLVALAWQKIQKLHAAEKQAKEEIAQLREWLA